MNTKGRNKQIDDNFYDWLNRQTHGGSNVIDGTLYRDIVAAERRTQMKELEMVERAQKALFEHGPMTLTEIKSHVGRCNKEHLRGVLDRNENIFHIIGWMRQPSSPPQHIYGLVGVKQDLLPEEKKKHPFDLPKHSIIYRELMEQQRVKYERY